MRANKLSLASILLLILFGITQQTYAQNTQDDHLRRLSKEAQKNQVRTPQGWYHDPKPHGRIRKIISFFNVELTTGLGTTYYAHRGEGLAWYSGTNGVRLFNPNNYNGASVSSALNNWVNAPVTGGSFGVGPNDFLVSTDTAKVRYVSKSRNIPFNAALFFRIQRFKIGGGVSFEPQFIGAFKPRQFKDDLEPFRIDPRLVFVKKYYGMLGGDVYRYQDFLFSADLRVGVWNPGRKFDLGNMQRSVLWNFGGGVEWTKSDYFRPYVRTSFELKNYLLTVPETPNIIRHRANQFTVNVGVILRMPELPKCFIKNCRTQMNHQHGDREYRSRAHPIWKNQNPNYGENFPRLFKYRWKNKKKMRPY